MEKTLRFVWFWTFWHWSKESSRAGLLPRGPVAGIAANWEEWFRGRSSEEDLLAIEEAGRTRASQTQFVTWLFRHWAKESDRTANRLLPRFILGQLANVEPFVTWRALARYRHAYGTAGIPAVILTEESNGTAQDVRSIEALLLPDDHAAPAGKIEAEGFKAETGDLRLPHGIALSLLTGKARSVFFALWLASGRRPHGRWMGAGLGFGWLSTAAMVLWLLLGPDPGDQLPAWCALLLASWMILVAVSTVTVLRQARHFWQEGHVWARALDDSRTRLRMKSGGLTVRGGSAGLAFTLNTVLAAYRAHPDGANRSWIWGQVFQTLDRDGRKWAATGVLTETGWIKSVILEPKLRACIQHSALEHVLTPHQRGATGAAVEHLTETMRPHLRPTPAPLQTDSGFDSSALGFAAEKRDLQIHRCRHVAEALISIGGLWSGWQIGVNLLAFAVSLAVLAALPDFRSALLPSTPPPAVAPASSSPYYLWVSLDTEHARDFQVVLESRFWTNRRANVVAESGANASNRAEIRLIRLSHSTTNNPEDGIVWVERRRKFLSRDYAPGERVGQYFLSYLNRLGRE